MQWGINVENHWIDDWLSVRIEAEGTRKSYVRRIKKFAAFCQAREANFDLVVEEWRTAHYQGTREEQMFLDKWNDLIRSYSTTIKPQYVSLSFNLLLAVVKSFFRFWKIPVDVNLLKRAYVTYHNRDLTKPMIKEIMAKASQRNRTIFLVLAESGLRAQSICDLMFWQIRDDFEADRVPMMILTPSSTLKDHVGDRWSFIGEDGVKALREYLKPRLPLHDQDYVFASEKPYLVKGKQFTECSLSTIFRRITLHLKMERGAPAGKPGHYRLHGLRKYFRNNMKADESYREFWMGHSIGVDAHYISRDPEEHRKRYAEGYEQLRIQAPAISATQLKNIDEQLKTKDQEIQQLQAQVKELNHSMQIWRDFLENNKQSSQNPVEKLLEVIEFLSKNDPKSALNIKTLDFPKKKNDTCR